MNLSIRGLKLDAGSGAGSRGGRVIGRTKSGKPIYASSMPKSTKGSATPAVEIHHKNKDLTAQEHGEAEKLHLKAYNHEGGAQGGPGAVRHALAAKYHAQQAANKKPVRVKADPAMGSTTGRTSTGKPIYRASSAAYSSRKKFNSVHAGWTKAEHAEAASEHKVNGMNAFGDRNFERRKLHGIAASFHEHAAGSRK